MTGIGRFAGRLVLSALAAGVGVLAPLRVQLQGPALSLGDGAAPTLANVTGLSPWIVIAALVVSVGIWLVRGTREPEHGTWPWSTSGAAVGGLITLG